MKNLFTTVTMFLALGGTVFAQSAGFQRAANLGGDDYANMSVPGDYGTHYIVGSTTAAGGGSYDAFIAHVDTAGQVLWEKQYGGSGTEYGTALIRTDDDNLLLVGRSNSYSSSFDMFVVKTDLSGNVLWAKVIGTDSTDYALNVAENDNGYLIVGQTKGAQSGPGRWDIPLIMLDQNGNELWTKSYGSQYSNETGFDVKEVGDNSWLIAGYTGLNNIGLNDGVFSLLDSAGNIQASFEVGSTGDEDIRKIVLPDDEGSAFFVGNTRSFNVGGGQDIFIAKYDVSQQVPTLSWFKTYGGDGSESITDAQPTPDGQIVITALTGSYSNNDDGLVFVVDTNGTVLMTKVVGSNAGSDVVMGIEVSDDPLLVGYSNSFNGGGANDLYFLRPGDNIDLGCHSFDTTLVAVDRTVSTLGPTIADLAVNALTVTTSSPTNITFSNTAVDSNLCGGTNVGIHDIDGITAYHLYPNPAQQQIHVVFDNTAPAAITYSIINVYGAVVYQNTMQESAGSINKQLNVSHLAAGSYLLQITNGKSRIAKRFVIMQ